jgi:hypothetical protein
VSPKVLERHHCREKTANKYANNVLPCSLVAFAQSVSSWLSAVGSAAVVVVVLLLLVVVVVVVVIIVVVAVLVVLVVLVVVVGGVVVFAVVTVVVVAAELSLLPTVGFTRGRLPSC